MSSEHEDFARWLRERAAFVGYDTTKRGMISRLAEASGNDPAQMSRFLRGQAIPAIDGQRGLAKALKVKLPEVMIRAGSAQPEDFDDVAPRTPSYEIERAAELLGVPPGKRTAYVRLMKSMALLTGSKIIDPAETRGFDSLADDDPVE
ncbi:helix-turn-helix domain-containing protein [Streptacidiphilus sp. PAMC 29251]